MTNTEINLKEKEAALIESALVYLQGSRTGNDSVLAAYRLTTHWDKLVSEYEKEIRTHFWSKRRMHLVDAIVKKYIETKSAEKGGQDVRKAKN